MCRNIRVLFNFAPPATEAEIHAASIQFVRKISGFHTPSKVNEAAFNKAIAEVSRTASDLLKSLECTAPPKDRIAEAMKAKLRSAKRFGPKPGVGT